MICIHPDVIEKMPRSCNDCPFAYFDEVNNASYYCGISRFSINKQHKQKTRHKGCAIYNPDPDSENTENEKDKREKKVVIKEETPNDVAKGIINKAKEISDSLIYHDDVDDVELEDFDLGMEDIDLIENEDFNGEPDDGQTETD